MGSQGQFPSIPYVLFELGIYVTAAYVLVKLWRTQPEKVPRMLVAMVFAGALEIFDIRTTHTYHYDRFLLMWGDWPNWFPICIAVAWGLVLHSTMEAGEHLFASRWARPPMVAVLAVSVDLLLDPVVASSRIVAEPGMACDATWVGPGQAIGLGFWVWCVPEAEHSLIWGIPFGNFYAWGAVTLGFSAVAEVLQARFGKRATLGDQWVLAVVNGVVGYHAVQLLIQAYPKLIVYAHLPEWSLMLAMFLPGFVLIARAGARRTDRPVLLTTWIFVATTLSFCYTAMVTQSVLRDRLTLVFVLYSLAVGVATVGLYYWVLCGRRAPRTRTASISTAPSAPAE